MTPTCCGDHLNTWRKTLCDELLTIKSPIRDSVTMGLSQNLTVSLRAIDFGASQFSSSQWALENSRLGELMVASGYVVVGADPSRHYIGRLPWHGSLAEVGARLTQTEQRRTRAQQQLDSALMDDVERAKHEADAKRMRDLVNALHPRGPNLAVDETNLTDEQREALAWARTVWAREPVSG